MFHVVAFYHVGGRWSPIPCILFSDVSRARVLRVEQDLRRTMRQTERSVMVFARDHTLMRNLHTFETIYFN